MSRSTGYWTALGLTLSAAPLAWAQTGPIPTPISKGSEHVTLKPIASGLVAPNDLTTAPDGSGRLFVTDQSGAVRIIQNGSLLPTPFLDVSSRLVPLMGGYDERGLLGLAFHPDFNNPNALGYHKLYTYSSEPVSGPADFTVPLPPNTAFNHQSVLTEWTVSIANANLVDPASRREVMRIDEPQFNHNGGALVFGPDHYLYMSLGDGGQGNDVGAGHSPQGNGQDTTNILGSLVRIDVDARSSANGQYGVPAGNPFAGSTTNVNEIYANGFRNPFRFSFDAPTGKLYVADVGQNNIEELDDVVLGGNYGWHLKEGTFLFNPSDGSVSPDTHPDPNLIDPILQYDHDEGIAIIGGFVYHGSLLPSLEGKYVFADLSKGFGSPNGRLFYADLTTGQINEFHIDPLDAPLGKFVKGFGQDDDGELYVLVSDVLGPSGTTGQVMMLVPEPASLGLLVLLPLLGMRRRRAS